ncbi:hypothetical protein CsSME_00014908 [Camellia sinensis var. sinensis]
MASSQGMQLQLQPQPIIMMLLLVQVQVVVVVIFSLSAAIIAAPPTEADLRNLGCVNSCGNLNISYPFGGKKDCYHNENFFINCSDSQPYYGNVLVTNISLEEGELRIFMPFIANECYDSTGSLLSRGGASLDLSTFSISNSKNKFTAIGCDTSGSVQITNKTGSLVVATGCQSQCRSINSVPNDGSCSGIGCCQTSIPKGVGKIEYFVNSFFKHANITDFNPCSYAFVVEDSAFNFSTTYLQDFKPMVPMVLDWGIGDNETCEAAKKNQTNYACGQNTACYDAEDGNGYICKCFDGYEGNAYLSDGCKDIDECAKSNQCVDGTKCLNTPPGNYTCSCPKRYHGDGKTNGTRCTADPDFVLHIVIGVTISALAILVSSSWLYWIFKKRKHMKLKEKFFRQNGGLILKQQLSRLERSTREVVKIFTLEELKQATNNYDDNRIVGRGGFGIVYKGILANNTTVAIKKSQIMNQSQIEQFINEVVVLSQINHRNVVKLLGCCLETQVPLLVYEFITNGTLFEHIHNQIKASNFSWENRLRIAAETAGVLAYLHSAASIPIIHRDVKSTNILLDDNYTAKVSDFGASRLVPLDQDQLATVVQGTLGYLDPEYMLTNQLTEKSDVYSFGVVLVELITGKKVLSFDKPEKERSLARHFLSCMQNDQLFQVIDEQIEIEGIVEELTEVANIAKMCLIVKGEERPTMKEVAMELEGLIIKNMKKHPWVKIDLNGEESEHLLHRKLSGYEFGGCTTSISNTIATGYDSVREHMMLPMNGGR